MLSAKYFILFDDFRLPMKRIRKFLVIYNSTCFSFLALSGAPIRTNMYSEMYSGH